MHALNRTALLCTIAVIVYNTIAVTVYTIDVKDADPKNKKLYIILY